MANSFWNGVKKGAGCAIGAGLVCGALGLMMGGPGTAVLGFKMGVGLGGIGSGAG